MLGNSETKQGLKAKPSPDLYVNVPDVIVAVGTVFNPDNIK